mmetsp:Transcript_19591/g.46992  ORF Transcript_19591/g.46992 Transcript_19591/m.46992 type:complete len:457 (-) Transcript_19591:791-2161(-)
MKSWVRRRREHLYEKKTNVSLYPEKLHDNERVLQKSTQNLKKQRLTAAKGVCIIGGSIQENVCDSQPAKMLPPVRDVREHKAPLRILSEFLPGQTSEIPFHLVARSEQPQHRRLWLHFPSAVRRHRGQMSISTMLRRHSINAREGAHPRSKRGWVYLVRPAVAAVYEGGGGDAVFGTQRFPLVLVGHHDRVPAASHHRFVTVNKVAVRHVHQRLVVMTPDAVLLLRRDDDGIEHRVVPHGLGAHAARKSHVGDMYRKMPSSSPSFSPFIIMPLPQTTSGRHDLRHHGSSRVPAQIDEYIQFVSHHPLVHIHGRRRRRRRQVRKFVARFAYRAYLRPIVVVPRGGRDGVDVHREPGPVVASEDVLHKEREGMAGREVGADVPYPYLPFVANYWIMSASRHRLPSRRGGIVRLLGIFDLLGNVVRAYRFQGARGITPGDVRRELQGYARKLEGVERVQ